MGVGNRARAFRNTYGVRASVTNPNRESGAAETGKGLGKGNNHRRSLWNIVTAKWKTSKLRSELTPILDFQPRMLDMCGQRPAHFEFRVHDRFWQKGQTNSYSELLICSIPPRFSSFFQAIFSMAVFSLAIRPIAARMFQQIGWLDDLRRGYRNPSLDSSALFALLPLGFVCPFRPDPESKRSGWKCPRIGENRWAENCMLETSATP